MGHSRRLLAMAGTVVVVIAVCGGVAWATGVTLPFSGDGNTINGCYNPSDGTLRLLTPKAPTCAKSQTPIAWSQTGPAGIDGTNGADGQPGLSGYVRVSSPQESLRSEDGTSGATVFCPLGTKVLG